MFCKSEWIHYHNWDGFHFANAGRLKCFLQWQWHWIPLNDGKLLMTSWSSDSSTFEPVAHFTWHSHRKKNRGNEMLVDYRGAQWFMLLALQPKQQWDGTKWCSFTRVQAVHFYAKKIKNGYHNTLDIIINCHSHYQLVLLLLAMTWFIFQQNTIALILSFYSLNLYIDIFCKIKVFNL